MEYSFDIDYAKQYGVNAAILLKNFQFWIMKNKANERHEHDGRTWTYNSVRAFAELYEFLSEKQIRHAIDLLIKSGVIMTGNFNEKKYDRTTWYAFCDESLYLKGQMDLPCRADGFAPEGEPIPDNKPVIKPPVTKKPVHPDYAATVALFYPPGCEYKPDAKQCKHIKDLLKLYPLVNIRKTIERLRVLKDSDAWWRQQPVVPSIVRQHWERINERGKGQKTVEELYG